MIIASIFHRLCALCCCEFQLLGFSEPAEERGSQHEPVQAWELDGGKTSEMLCA